ncbi:MAG: hypothetical protein AAGG69_12615, partial [Pseudomonadota bacterium]
MANPTWSDWQPWDNPSASPVDAYAHWDAQINGSTSSRRAIASGSDSLQDLQVDVAHGLRLIRDECSGGAGRTTSDDLLEKVSASIPHFARNDAYQPGTDWYPNVRARHAPAPGSVIVGIIDRGIALGHRAQQMPDGTTRIVGAWQQVAPNETGSGNTERFPKGPSRATRRIPIGMGLLAPNINKALRLSRTEASNPNSVDQETFNRFVGSQDYTQRTGHRELGWGVAHGTHVLDAATGSFQGASGEADFRDKVRPMIVNLPDRTVIGLDSRFLTAFAQLGMLWMVMTADRYWRAAHGSTHPSGKLKGYPIVINLSFAKLAGAKDGDDEISRLVQAINDARPGYIPIHLVVPAGNDNLSRSYAEANLDSKSRGSKGRTTDLRLRIPPADQSSNYVEVWSEAAPAANGDISPNVALQVTDPMGSQSTATVPIENQVCFLNNGGLTPVAAIYCDAKTQSQPNGKTLFRYLVCVAPTEVHDASAKEAQSGIWDLQISNLGSSSTIVTCGVQTDQSPQPYSRRAQLAYFDDPEYQRFDDATGRTLDSVTYPRTGTPVDNDEQSGSVVTRHGTINALGGMGTATNDVTIIAGFRTSDGKPALYSSTGWETTAPNGGVIRPDCSLPSDDGIAHRGQLAAGTSDGSVRAMQGTSFACAKMTRLIALKLIQSSLGTPSQAAQAILSGEVASQEQSTWSPLGQV